jgi:hypothetical protein
MKVEDPNWIMGFQLVEDSERRTINISHAQYITSILKRFRHSECNPISTPMEPGLNLTKLETDNEDTNEKELPHRELVGSVLWTSLICHPEISFCGQGVVF